MTTKDEALRMALEALIWTTGSDDFGDGGKAREGALKLLFPSIAALRERLAQPEQEPVAVVRSVVGQGDDGVRIKWLSGFPQIGDRLYTAPPMSQCPVCGLQRGFHHSVLPGCTCTTASPMTYPVQPPKHEWKCLTDEEMNSLAAIKSGLPLYRAIEAKLKEKNTSEQLNLSCKSVQARLARQWGVIDDTIAAERERCLKLATIYHFDGLETVQRMIENGQDS